MNVNTDEIKSKTPRKSRKPAKKNVKVEPMSIQEFKIWIKGLSAFQDDSWYPSKPQWDHIMRLIDMLKEEPVEYAQVSNPMVRTTVELPAGNNAPEVAPAQRFLGGQPVITKSITSHRGQEVLEEPFTESNFI